MNLEEPVLKVENLWKSFSHHQVVRDVSFSVFPGDIYGFLGPNGAGKTTIIRMLVGLIKPDKGKVCINGQDLKGNFTEAMKSVGCIVENPELYKYLTGWENLLQFGRMIGLQDENKILEIVAMVKLTERIHEKVGNYSLGMKQRLGIAQALLTDPKLLILDEPTNGLDPAGIHEMRDFIHFLVEERGMSVFLSSHHLSEIQLLCNRVGIIQKGEIIKESSVAQLIEDAGETYYLETNNETLTKRFLEKNDISYEEVERGFSLKVEESKIPQIIIRLVALEIEIYEIRKIQQSLEQLFLQLTNERDRI